MHFHEGGMFYDGGKGFLKKNVVKILGKKTHTHRSLKTPTVSEGYIPPGVKILRVVYTHRSCFPVQSHLSDNFRFWSMWDLCEILWDPCGILVGSLLDPVG